MIKDYFDSEDYNDLDIINSEMAGKIFRDFVDQRDGRKRETKISEYYDRLTDRKKKIVWHMITCLLPENKREQNLKGYFAELMKERNMSRAELINRITVKKKCDYILGKEPVDCEKDVIKSKIENFSKVMNPDNNSYLLDDICRLLNVDMKALTTGYGKEYSIDEINLARIIKSKGFSADQYLQKFVNEYIPCDRCKERKKCKKKIRETICNYLLLDKKSIAEALSKDLGVSLEDILDCNDIVIAADNLSFDEYYGKLSKHDREVIYFLICDLFALED